MLGVGASPFKSMKVKATLICEDSFPVTVMLKVPILLAKLLVTISIHVMSFRSEVIQFVHIVMIQEP